MAHPGLEVGDPNGERIIFRRTTAQTGAELVEVEAVYAPHSPRPPSHFHPRQEERFTVVDGTITANIGGQE